MYHRLLTRVTAGILTISTVVLPAFAATGTVSADGGLRLRTGASTSASILTTLPNGATIDVTTTDDSGWYQASYGSYTGYVSSEYVSVAKTTTATTTEVASDATYVKVTEGPLNVRAGNSVTNSIVRQLSTGAVVEVVETLDGWYRISDGYISSDYAVVVDAEEAAAAQSGSAIADFALQYVGTPYVYGGSSPSGWDCSGFVQYVYKQFGVTINRTASAQMDNGTPVSFSDLQPGDAVFFKKSGSSASRASHVGIYIGNGQFVHASDYGVGTIVSDLDYAYYTTGFVGGRRMV